MTLGKNIDLQPLWAVFYAIQKGIKLRKDRPLIYTFVADSSF